MAGYGARTYVWELVFVFYKNMNKACVPVSLFIVYFLYTLARPQFIFPRV